MSLDTFINEKALLAYNAQSWRTFGLQDDQTLLSSRELFACDSDEQINRKLDEARKKVKISKMVSIPLALFFIALTIASASIASPIAPLITGLVCFVLFCFVLVEIHDKHEKWIRYGKTLEQSGNCMAMQKLAQKSPMVAQYIQTVVAKRQLYLFDYIVADGLAEHEKQVNDKAERARLNKQACVELHSQGA